MDNECYRLRYIYGLPVRIVNDDISEGLSRAADDICAIDTETTGLEWNGRDWLQLVQVYVPGYGIDLMRVNLRKPLPSRLIKLMQDRRCKKIFHHAMFDLRFICSTWPCFPVNVSCTKVASKILIPKSDDHHLQSLLLNRLDIAIDKTHQKGHWGDDELSKEQVVYAVNDTLYLPALLADLERALHVANLLPLAHACYQHIPTRLMLELGGYRDVFLY